MLGFLVSMHVSMTAINFKGRILMWDLSATMNISHDQIIMQSLDLYSPSTRTIYIYIYIYMRLNTQPPSEYKIMVISLRQ